MKPLLRKKKVAPAPKPGAGPKAAAASKPRKPGTGRRAKPVAPKRLPPIPADVELAGQEPPPEVLGQDRSRQRSKIVELDWARFGRLAQELAQEIRKAYAPEAVVGVAHGGVFVGGAVASALGCEFYPVRISRRSRDKGVRKDPRMSGEMPRELKGKRVLVVDDVASSGDTLELAQALARKVGAKDVATACLVAREGGYVPGWAALPTDALVVFPWDYEPVAEDERFDVDPDKAGA